ncbi:MAG: hypothetical protein ACM3S4_01385 [Burkholderiales bacterium]
MFFGNCIVRRVVGCFLMFIGIILLICFMPFWMWVALLGIVLLVLGSIIIVRGIN